MSSKSSLTKRFFEEVVNGRNFSVIDEIIHEDYINHGFPIKAKGPEAMKAISSMMIEAFPDMHINVENYMNDRDMYAQSGSWTGTHKGVFMGIPATGKTVTVSFVDMWKAKDGKLHENWVQMDFVGLLNQIGAMPH